MARLAYLQCKIASGQSLSADVDLRNHRVVAIQCPPVVTAPTGGLSFQATIYNDGTRALSETFGELIDDTAAAVLIAAGAVTANTVIALTTATRDKLSCASRIKLRSGPSGTPVVAGQDEVFTFICEPRDAMS